MDYIKIRLNNDFEKSESQFDKTIEDMFQSLSPMFSLSERSWKPSMDIYEAPDEILIIADVAGAKKNDLDIEINAKSIKISGRRACVQLEKDTKYRLAEIQYGPFERILFLPALIDSEKVSATYTNGFLKIRMKKRPREKTITIPINEG